MIARALRIAAPWWILSIVGTIVGFIVGTGIAWGLR